MINRTSTEAGRNYIRSHVHIEGRSLFHVYMSWRARQPTALEVTYIYILSIQLTDRNV